MGLFHWKGRIRKEMAGREGGGRDRNGVSSMLWFVWGQWKEQRRQTMLDHMVSVRHGQSTTCKYSEFERKFLLPGH